jgi:hypothetical protein
MLRRKGRGIGGPRGELDKEFEDFSFPKIDLSAVAVGYPQREPNPASSMRRKAG